jgi:hypothetical protein
LKHDPLVWHFRCLRCGGGVELLDYQQVDRRRPDGVPAAHQKRRLSDLRIAAPCRRCGHDDVRGWFAAQDTLWVRCERCSLVAPVDAAPDTPVVPRLASTAR